MAQDGEIPLRLPGGQFPNFVGGGFCFKNRGSAQPSLLAPWKVNVSSPLFLLAFLCRKSGHLKHSVCQSYRQRLPFNLAHYVFYTSAWTRCLSRGALGLRGPLCCGGCPGHWRTTFSSNLGLYPQAPVVPPPLPFIPPGCLQILLNTPWGEGTLSPFESHRPGLFSVS